MRPYSTQRRWSIRSGEIEKAQVPAERALPHWPTTVFSKIPKGSAVVAGEAHDFDAAILELRDEIMGQKVLFIELVKGEDAICMQSP